MKESKIPGIVNCPICGHQPILRRNASKLFQVQCPKCRAHTSWKRKVEAVITWYNMAIQYAKNNDITLTQE